MKELVELGSRYVRKEQTVAAEIDGDLVMMSLEKNAYFGLDAIGRAIYEKLDRSQSVDEICQCLAKDFDVSIEQCREDVLEFLNELLLNGLVDTVPQKA